jgi:hypothetical protein
LKHIAVAGLTQGIHCFGTGDGDGGNRPAFFQFRYGHGNLQNQCSSRKADASRWQSFGSSITEIAAANTF